MVFPLKKSISKFEYDVPLIPLISMKYVIEVIAIPPKIDERINDFFSNLNVKINLEIHWTIAPIEKAIKTDKTIPKTIWVALV